MPESKVPLLIRIPANLKARLVDLAKREHRSVNQQIESLLEASFKVAPAHPSAPIDLRRREKNEIPRDHYRVRNSRVNRDFRPAMWPALAN